MAGFEWTLLAQAAQNEGQPMSLGLKFGIAMAVAIGSYLAGQAAARSIRLPDYGNRISLVLATLLLGITICVLDWPPKKGIDLSGGVVLVYEVDTNQMKRTAIGEAVGAIEQRLGKLGDSVATIDVQEDQGRIEIVVADKDDERAVADELAGLSGTYALRSEGRRLEKGKVVLPYHVDLRRNFNMEELTSAITKRINPEGLLEVAVRRYGEDQIEIIIPEVETREVDQIKRLISTSGFLEFRILADPKQPADRRLIELARHTPGRDVYDRGRLEGHWAKLGPDVGVGPSDIVREGSRGGEILVKIDRFHVTGDDLSRASPGMPSVQGMAVDFSMTSKGAGRFGALTGANIPNPETGAERRLGILLDDELLSAPNIKSQIRDSGQITGRFSEKEVNFLVDLLNRGRLPAVLNPNPLSEQKISAQLGEETIIKGRDAMIVSTLCVLVFMVFYYRFAGLVADFAVVMNMILALALMLMVNAAITLPGLAGFVLTVGMAVDANVLIYERMREEAVKGASFRMTIRNGFSRAMSTIIDSNLTTVISGVVLFIVGTDQVKGFAVTLILGLVVSLYTAVYVARVIFDIVERKRWVTKLRMRQFIGETHIDFVKWRAPAIAASVVVIAIGMVGVGVRGAGLFDIDFTGGSSVHVLFKQPQDAGRVRSALQLEDLAVSGVGTKNVEFKIDTSEPNIADVERKIVEAFGADIATYTMKVGAVEKYVPSPAAKPGERKAPEGGASSAPVKPSGAEPAAPQSTPAPAQKPAAGGAEQPAGATSSPAPEPAAPNSPPPATSSEPAKTPEPPAVPGGSTPATPESPASPGPKGAQRGPSGPAPKALARFASATRSAPIRFVATTLALADAPSGPAPAANPSPPAGGEAPAATNPAATTTPPPAATAPPTTAPPAAAPAEPPAGSASETGAENNAAAAPPTEGATAKLTFEEPISHAALAPIIEDYLKQRHLENTTFELLNPAYKPGSSTSYSEWTLRIMLPVGETEKMLQEIQAKLNASPVFPSSNQIGGKVAGRAKIQAFAALMAAMVMIVIYVWIRFQNLMFGLAAVLALIHDVLVTVGFLALSTYLAPFLSFALVDDFKISLAVVAALLTIIGYSINDTIVIFDRIREVRGKSHDLNERMINLSVNQTLGRTLLTSGTVLIGTVILYFFGGEGIHAFAYAMLVGLISGTYSTVYIASPVLLWLRRADERAGSATPVAARTKAAG